MGTGSGNGEVLGMWPGLRAILESPAGLTHRRTGTGILSFSVSQDLRPGSVISMLGELGQRNLLLRASVSSSIKWT